MLAQSTIGSRFEFDTEDAWPVIPAPSFALLLLISQRGRINPGDVDCSKSARDAVPARQRQTRWAQQALWTGSQESRSIAFRFRHRNIIASSGWLAQFNPRQ